MFIFMSLCVRGVYGKIKCGCGWGEGGGLDEMKIIGD